MLQGAVLEDSPFFMPQLFMPLRYEETGVATGASALPRQRPFDFQARQAQRSHLSSASTSQSAHANISARYTHIGTEKMPGCGSAETVRSTNHENCPA